MMDWIQDLPLLPAVAFLYVVIWCRAGATYLVGRGARKAANRGRVAALALAQTTDRAVAAAPSAPTVKIGRAHV